MNKFTIRSYRPEKPIHQRSRFGGQFYLMLLTYMAYYNKAVKGQFCYNDIGNFKCFENDKVSFEDHDEMVLVNNTLASFFSNLSIGKSDKETVEIQSISEIPYISNDDIFNSKTLANIQNAWPLAAPQVDNKILTIHMRLGDVPSTWSPPYGYYSKLIRKCLDIFPEHTIQTISWGRPDIDKDLESKIIMNYEVSGYQFMDHFNQMVHSDILIAAYSSFSISAGFLNKNSVLCNTDVWPANDIHPKRWDTNFERLK